MPAKPTLSFTPALICPHCVGLLNQYSPQHGGRNFRKHIGATKWDLRWSVALGIYLSLQITPPLADAIFGDAWQTMSLLGYTIIWVIGIIVTTYLSIRIIKFIFKKKVTWVEVKQKKQPNVPL